MTPGRLRARPRRRRMAVHRDQARTVVARQRQRPAGGELVRVGRPEQGGARHRPQAGQLLHRRPSGLLDRLVEALVRQQIDHRPAHRRRQPERRPHAVDRDHRRAQDRPRAAMQRQPVGERRHAVLLHAAGEVTSGKPGRERHRHRSRPGRAVGPGIRERRGDGEAGDGMQRHRLRNLGAERREILPPRCKGSGGVGGLLLGAHHGPVPAGRKRAGKLAGELALQPMPRQAPQPGAPRRGAALQAGAPAEPVRSRRAARVAGDQRRPSVAQRPRDRAGNRLRIGGVDAAHCPAAGGEPGRRVRPVQLAGAGGLEQHRQLVQRHPAGQGRRLERDAGGEIGLAGQDPGAVIDQGAAEPPGQHAFGHRHADRGGEPLAGRPGRRLHRRMRAPGAVGRRGFDPGLVQQTVEQRPEPPRRQHEAVAIRPAGVGGVEMQKPLPEHRRRHRDRGDGRLVLGRRTRIGQHHTAR